VVARTEPGLGRYDAPALQIRFGPSEVNVVPMSHRIDVPRFEVALDASHSLAGESIPLFEGRVDVTEGYRKIILYREVRDGGDHWWICDERNRFTPLGSESFARVLQDLLS